VAVPPQPYATPTAPPPAPAASPPRLPPDRRRLWLAVGVGGVLLLLVAYLVSGPLIAGAQAKSQTRSLQHTGSDLTKIDAFLSNTDVRDSNKLDSAGFKAAVDAYNGKLTNAAATLVGDQDRLDQVNRDIDFYSIFTPLQNSTMHSNDATIRHAKRALDDFAKTVGILRTETSFYSAIATAEVDTEAADKAVRNHDLTTASVNDQKAVADLAQCKLLDRDADVPPQFAPLVELYSKIMTDVTGFTESANAQDLVGALQYLQALIRDDQAVHFDQAGYLAWYSQKFNPILTDFRANAGSVPRYVVTSTKLV
jgi:hypothetical protein